MDREKYLERHRRYNQSYKGRERGRRYDAKAENRLRKTQLQRRARGWYEPGGMATAEELAAFLDAIRA